MKDHDIFAECRAVVDVTRFVEACSYDLCSDENEIFRDFYFCNTIQAYTFECANRGIMVHWSNHTDMVQLQNACARTHSISCPGGSYYNECARTVDASCQDLGKNKKYLTNFNCQPGCSCPEGEYYDIVLGEMKCVPKAQCPCYTKDRKPMKPGEVASTLCSTW